MCKICTIGWLLRFNGSYSSYKFERSIKIWRLSQKVDTDQEIKNIIICWKIDTLRMPRHRRKQRAVLNTTQRTQTTKKLQIADKKSVLTSWRRTVREDVCSHWGPCINISVHVHAISPKRIHAGILRIRATKYCTYKFFVWHFNEEKYQCVSKV